MGGHFFRYPDTLITSYLHQQSDNIPKAVNRTKLILFCLNPCIGKGFRPIDFESHCIKPIFYRMKKRVFPPSYNTMAIIHKPQGKPITARLRRISEKKKFFKFLKWTAPARRNLVEIELPNQNRDYPLFATEKISHSKKSQRFLYRQICFSRVKTDLEENGALWAIDCLVIQSLKPSGSTSKAFHRCYVKHLQDPSR